MSSSKFLAHKSGTFVHLSEFNKLKDHYTLKNLKKVKAIRMGQVWVNKPTLPSGKPNKSYMLDTLKCYKMKEGSQWVQIPAGLRSTISFENHYDNQVVEHPPLTRQSYDYQSSAIRELMTGSVGLLHADTGSGKTQMICDITFRAKRNTLIMVQNLTQMKQMVDDIFHIMGVIPTQVSGKKPSKKEQATWYAGITVCSIDSRTKIGIEDYGLVLLDECLRGDSLITTERGQVPIKDLHIGDSILSYNHKTNKKEWRIMTNFWEKKTTKKMMRIKTKDGRELYITENHPVWVEGYGYTKACDLKIGDELLTE